MKILIVEDEPALRELIQRSLEKERYVTETAADFDSALEKIEVYDYDCILLDIMLPGGSGLELLGRLKELRKKENVIITCVYCFCPCWHRMYRSWCFKYERQYIIVARIPQKQSFCGGSNSFRKKGWSWNDHYRRRNHYV